MSSLHRAVLEEDVINVQDLMELGFNPRAVDSRGITALELAEGILIENVRKQVLAALGARP